MPGSGLHYCICPALCYKKTDTGSLVVLICRYALGVEIWFGAGQAQLQQQQLAQEKDRDMMMALYFAAIQKQPALTETTASAEHGQCKSTDITKRSVAQHHPLQKQEQQQNIHHEDIEEGHLIHESKEAAEDEEVTSIARTQLTRDPLRAEWVQYYHPSAGITPQLLRVVDGHLHATDSTVAPPHLSSSMELEQVRAGFAEEHSPSRKKKKKAKRSTATALFLKEHMDFLWENLSGFERKADPLDAGRGEETPALGSPDIPPAKAYYKDLGKSTYAQQMATLKSLKAKQLHSQHCASRKKAATPTQGLLALVSDS